MEIQIDFAQNAKNIPIKIKLIMNKVIKIKLILIKLIMIKNNFDQDNLFDHDQKYF